MRTKKLSKVPSVILIDENGKYECYAYEDVLEISFFEDYLDGEGMQKRTIFTIPTYCARQVLSEMLKLVNLRGE